MKQRLNWTLKWAGLPDSTKVLLRLQNRTSGRTRIAPVWNRYESHPGSLNVEITIKGASTNYQNTKIHWHKTTTYSNEMVWMHCRCVIVNHDHVEGSSISYSGSAHTPPRAKDFINEARYLKKQDGSPVSRQLRRLLKVMWEENGKGPPAVYGSCCLCCCRRSAVLKSSVGNPCIRPSLCNQDKWICQFL